MVSASQLEASFKQAADSSKSGQGQESIDELELTDYATGKVDDEQVTEYEVQQVDAEEEQKQLDELTLSDTHETFNHSEPYSRTREDSVLREDLSIENQDSFLQTVELYFLYNTLTISKLKDYMSECAALGWLEDQDFAYRFTKTIGAILERGGLSYETLEGVETLAMEDNFALLEDYLCDLLDKRHKKTAWQGPPLRPMTEVTEQTRTGGGAIVLTFLVMVCGILFLANGFFTRAMVQSQPKKNQVISGLTGNELVSQGTVDKAASAISDLAKKSDKPISDTKKVVYETLRPLVGKVDSLILGCTHYPLLRPIIQNVMGPKVQLIDSGAECVRDISVLLNYFEINRSRDAGPLQHRFYTTANSQSFAQIGAEWLEKEIHVEHVTL